MKKTCDTWINRIDGTQTLEVVRANKDIEVTALAAGSNIDLLEKQIREFSPNDRGGLERGKKQKN